MEAQKFLFLDVDGVLNTYKTKVSKLDVDETPMKVLKAIVDKHNPTIVVSSTWRLSTESRNLLLTRLKEHGVIKDESTVKYTPDMKGHGTRDQEILLWLKFNTQNAPAQALVDLLPYVDDSEKKSYIEQLKSLSISSPKANAVSLNSTSLPAIQQFVVLDDDNVLKSFSSFYASALTEHFVHVNAKTGMVDTDVTKASEIFGTSFDGASWWQTVLQKKKEDDDRIAKRSAIVLPTHFISPPTSPKLAVLAPSASASASSANSTDGNAPSATPHHKSSRSQQMLQQKLMDLSVPHAHSSDKKDEEEDFGDASEWDDDNLDQNFFKKKSK